MYMRNTLRIVLALAIALASYIAPAVVSLHGLSAYVVPAALWISIFFVLYPFVKGYPAPYAEESMDSVPMLLLLSVMSSILLSLIFGFGINVNVVIPGLGLLNAIRSLPYALGLTTLIVAVLILPQRSASARILEIALIAMLVVMQAPLGKYLALLDLGVDAVFRFSVGRVLPAIALSLLFLKIGKLGGFRPLLIMVLGTQLIQQLMPVVPTAPWFAKSMASIAVPMTQYVMYLDYIGMLKEPRVKRYGVAALRSRIMKVLLIVFAILVMVSMVMGLRAFVVVSGSMVPMLHRGDIVIVSRVSPDEVRVGDVIAFIGSGALITHRVVGVVNSEEGIEFVTKGDANNAPDPEPVKPGNVVGRVAFVIPFVGLPLVFLATVLGSYVNALMFVTVVSILYYFALLTRFER